MKFSFDERIRNTPVQMEQSIVFLKQCDLSQDGSHFDKNTGIPHRTRPSPPHSSNMADGHEICVLLEKADLQQFLSSFLTLGATKISHFVDVDEQMMSGMGMTQLQIKRLSRIFRSTYENEAPTSESVTTASGSQNTVKKTKTQSGIVN